MIRKILGLALPLVAFIAGAGAGDYLRGGTAAANESGHAVEAAGGEAAEDGGDHGAQPAAAPGEADAEAVTDAKDHSAASAGGTAGHAAEDETKPADHGKAAAHGGSSAGGHGGGSDDKSSDGSGARTSGDTTWFQFPQQFFVPVMRNGRLESTMVLSLSLEVPAGSAEIVYAHELKLRDAVLRQLLIHANTGGFDGNFTAEPQLRTLRADLARTAQATVPEISAVLIGDIARQEAR